VFKEILLKLPGINNQNYFLIMKNFENLKDLSTATLKSLTNVLGTENGTKLFSFFTKELK
jgi:ERCC4-type nuclease